jgi:predicted MFS family arabinose efflux permease
MNAGLAALVLGYALSQFYRAFLAVLAPALSGDLGATPADLSQASGAWFLAFAAMQLPIGWSLDRFGPRRTAAVLLTVGAAGAALFATATGPDTVSVAMALIGVGCAPVLMASYFIFARSFPPALFGTLAGAVIGLGSIGNIAGSIPLAAATEAFGWRTTVAGMAVLTLLTALAIAVLVRDPPALPPGPRGRLRDLLVLPALWPILAMMMVCYAPAAALRGLWVGPYLADVFAADAARIGQVTLVMGLAMIAGNFAYGPLDRWLGTRKGVILGGNLLTLLCLMALWLAPAQGLWAATALLAGIGFFGASFPMVLAHGRAFLPANLTGRGVTLLNLFGIGATGLFQAATGWLHAASPATNPQAPYAAIFLAAAVLLAVGLAIYAFSRDRTD